MNLLRSGRALNGSSLLAALTAVALGLVIAVFVLSVTGHTVPSVLSDTLRAVVGGVLGINVAAHIKIANGGSLHADTPSAPGGQSTSDRRS